MRNSSGRTLRSAIALFVFLGLQATSAHSSDLIITGVIDGPLAGGIPKAIELYVANNLGDLSNYGLGSANNGDGSDGEEFPFPADSATAGDFIYVASEIDGFNTFFGFSPDYTTSAASINGDDAIELFMGGSVSDLFGDIDMDGTGQSWEYLDGWTYRSGRATAPSTDFSDGDWSYSGPNALDRETTNATAATPFPIGTYQAAVTPGVAIEGSPVDISEDGVEDSYTVALDATPPAQVDVTVEVFGGKTQVSKGGGATYADSVVLNLNDTTLATVHVRAVDDKDAEGNHTGAITHAASSDDPKYDAITMENAVANIKDVGITKIHEIQGDGEASPMETNEVTIDGIVIGDYQGTSSIKGFFVQEEDADADADPATSEGIFVYSDTQVHPGDRVRVTGIVKEYYDLTELSPVADVSVIGSGNPLPTAASVSLPVSAQNDWEKYEGMLVVFPQTLYVTDHYNLGSCGHVALSSGDRLCQPTQSVEPGAPANAVLNTNELNRIVLDDASTESNPDPILFSNNPPNELSADNSLRGGDTVTGLSAVLGYSFETYRLYPLNDQPPDFVNSNRRPTSAPDVGGALTVATFNVLNYFTTLGSGANCGPNEDQECRGASTLSEFTRQRVKLVSALTMLDADIVGLMELENTDQNAIADLAEGEDGLTGYAYVHNPGGDGVELGDDAITVGMIYKTATVSLVGGSATVPENFGTTDLGGACGSGSDGAYPFDHYNRKPLAQTFRHTETQEIFTVVVNHFKSKGSLTGYGEDEDRNDGQSANNCTRVQAAKTLLSWLATDPTSSGDSDFLVIGDMNSHTKEDPIQEFENAGYANEARDYSYLHYGQWGSLDYILSSPGMAPQVTGGAVWHINADEPRVLDYNEEYKTENQKDILYNADPYRSSDHDPVVVGLFIAACDVPPDGNWDLPSPCSPAVFSNPVESVSVGPGATLFIEEGGKLEIGGTGSGAYLLINGDSGHPAGDQSKAICFVDKARLYDLSSSI